jgi:hypothetical protein
MDEEVQLLLFMYNKLGNMKRSDFSTEESFNKVVDIFDELEEYFNRYPIS